MNIEYKIKAVSDYIQLHLDDELNIDLLCEIAHLSKFHFHRIFSSYTGIALAKYIQICRLKRASFQLAFDLDRKIIDIAFQAGFESPEAFTRAFKRCFDQTPSTFREEPDWQFWHQQFNFILPKIEKNMIVNIVEKSSEKIAYIRHHGAPERVYETAAKFIEWRKTTGLSPIKTSHTYGIPYSDPELTPAGHFVFDIAGQIDQEVPENEFGVSTASLPAGKYAVVRHFGSHDQLKDSVLVFRKWLPEQNYEIGDFPIYFHYLNFVHEVNEHELITDIYLLLKDKK